MFRTVILVSILALMGVAVQADISPMVYVDGHAMISLRAFCNNFDATVGYSVDRGAITITRGECTAYLTPYSYSAWIADDNSLWNDDRQVTLRQPVILIDDETYLPLRFMSHVFELNCTWSADQRQVQFGYSGGTVIFIRDEDWDRHPHVRRHAFDYHVYQYYHPRPPHDETPHHEDAHQPHSGNVSEHHGVVPHPADPHPAGGAHPEHHQMIPHPGDSQKVPGVARPEHHEAIPHPADPNQPQHSHQENHPAQPSHTPVSGGGPSTHNEHPAGNTGQPSHVHSDNSQVTGTPGSHGQHVNGADRPANHPQSAGRDKQPSGQHRSNDRGHGKDKPASEKKNDHKDKQ